jgi:hypothetical protein
MYSTNNNESTKKRVKNRKTRTTRIHNIIVENTSKDLFNLDYDSYQSRPKLREGHYPHLNFNILAKHA